MDRRNFLKTSSAVIAGVTVESNLPGTLAAQGMSASAGRMTLPMNRGWLYSPKVLAGGHDAGFDDAAMEKVVVPHTNIKLPWHSFDEKDYCFTSLYRRHFKLPPEAAGKRVFVDFEGVMTATTAWINGKPLGEYKGGYTPFSFELTPHLNAGGDNVLAIEVDSSERADIPPFGYQIDYLTFGGLYREVSLRMVPSVFIENMVARTSDVLSGSPKLAIEYYLQTAEKSVRPVTVEATVMDGDRVLATQKHEQKLAGAANEPEKFSIAMPALTGVELWDLDHPKMYSARVRILRGADVVDEQTRRFGFREAMFTDHGFSLNGTVLKLRGLDRHQTFPFVGQAMPARVQKRDAYILKHDLNCNIVRTSHYPQSRHFLDACDDYGLLVLEEIPGWQHIGPKPWQDISVDNVSRMIRRDWNHPSIILWGVRINESRDNHDFYTRTNAMAHSLDSRQTGGIRYFQESEFLEDVFTMNDFGWPLKAPNHPRYLNTEFVGHTYPVKQTDDDQRQRELAVRHARVHDTLASNPQYAGGIGWCAFDYNTHYDFGAGDRICYHGVTDIWREPKPAAGVYKSQQAPEKEVVLEPAFHWASSDEATHLQSIMICSNCDHLKLYLVKDGKATMVLEGDPDRAQFAHLKYAPFTFDVSKMDEFGDLRIEGYVAGKLMATKNMSGLGVDQKFVLLPDDAELMADGADTTRVVMRVTDEFGNIRPYANDPIVLTLEGPAELIGDNPFALVGGRGAVWVRTGLTAGKVTLTAKHPRLGTQTVTFTTSAVEAEKV